LAETASLEGIEGVVEGSAFVRLFEMVDWLLASQIKDSKLAINTRVKNTFFGMFASSFVFGLKRSPLGASSYASHSPEGTKATLSTSLL
jgi:hypothetical protein